jgi:adenosine deaminase
MKYLAEHRIGVETSLTSNVQTSAVPSYAEHPIKRFLQAGILDTLNTDDPGISAVTISDEYNQAAVKAGLTEEEIFQAQKNALEVAFLSQAEKEALVRKKAATS